MCAALGISQLNKIEKIIDLRRSKTKIYDNYLSKNPNIEVLPELDGFTNVYQLYSILLKNPDKRESLQNYLSENGISSKVYFFPIPLKILLSQNLWLQRRKFANYRKNFPENFSIAHLVKFQK